MDASGINAPDVHSSALMSPISTIAIAVTSTHAEDLTPRARDTLLHRRLCGLAWGLSFELHDSFGKSECCHVTQIYEHDLKAAIKTKWNNTGQRSKLGPLRNSSGTIFVLSGRDDRVCILLKMKEYQLGATFG